MKKLNKKELQAEYEKICNEYVKRFAKKQGIEFNFWAGDEVGVLAIFNDEYSFILSEIIHDINTGQKKGLILQWQNDTFEEHFNSENKKTINYKSYCMGLRYKDLK